MSTVVKVMLGILLAAMVLLAGCVGCVALVGNSIDDDFKKQQNKNSITNRQARSVSLGTPKSEVISEFGKPKSTQESENEGLGEDSCIYYNVKGGGALDQWQFCFDSDDQLTGKNRL